MIVNHPWPWMQYRAKFPWNHKIPLRRALSTIYFLVRNSVNIATTFCCLFCTTPRGMAWQRTSESVMTSNTHISKKICRLHYDYQEHLLVIQTFSTSVRPFLNVKCYLMPWQRFQREVSIWRELHDPNVVPLYGVIYIGDDLYSVSAISVLV